MEKFEKIPFFSKYEISKAGVVRNTTTGNVCKSKETKYGVLSVQLMTDLGGMTTRAIHSLLDATFGKTSEK